MIELTFQAGIEIVKFRVDGKKISICSQNFGWEWVDWDPAGLTATELSKLRRSKGEKWYQEYHEAAKRFEKMKEEEEVIKDLVKDMKKEGMELVKRE